MSMKHSVELYVSLNQHQHKGSKGRLQEIIPETPLLSYSIQAIS